MGQKLLHNHANCVMTTSSKVFDIRLMPLGSNLDKLEIKKPCELSRIRLASAAVQPKLNNHDTRLVNAVMCYSIGFGAQLFGRFTGYL